MASVCCSRVPRDESVQKRSSNPWVRLQAIADRMRFRVRKSFLAAAYEAAATIGPAKLLATLETGDVEAVLALLQPAEASFAQALRAGDLTAALTDTYSKVGIQEALDTGKALKTEAFSFDLTEPRAVQFLQAYDGNLITGFTDEVRKSIISVVQQGFRFGWNPEQQAQRIVALPTFGLTSRQNIALMNYENSLLLNGSQDVTGKVALQGKRMAAYRAEMIARTETIRAAEYGRLEAWQQAADRGLFDDEKARRQWIVTHDDRLCPYCQDVGRLNKAGVPFKDQFQTPEGDRITCPPSHPHCRCTQNIAFGEN
jgi:hypothetical protein